MKPQITSAEELIGWLCYNFPVLSGRGIYVSSQVRKEVLISERQGYFTAKGTVQEIPWRNMGAGVWLAFTVERVK